MIIDYQARKKEVINSYNQLEELVSELQTYAKKIGMPDPMDGKMTLLNDIRGKADRVKSDRFNIIVAGESKSGKSTFINAFLGIEILPMDVKQCTSSIIEIKNGNEFSVKATYADKREKILMGEKARVFLKKNAALDDEYREIPVPTINSEILVKAGIHAKKKGKSISIPYAMIKALLESKEVQAANIHNIPNYNEKIIEYIKKKKNNWKSIVTKIEVMFPLGEDMQGIEIIDSPGVCARGGVAEITSEYIENADAIIFLKPVIGQALESVQFNQFMENASVARNKNALFLVLTHIATINETDLKRLEEDAYKKFSSRLDERNILFVDSKAELYAKKFSKLEDEKEIADELKRLSSAKMLDAFVIQAYAESNGFFGEGDINDFIAKLKERSRFQTVYDAMNSFGRKAHYILLAALLESINTLYCKLWNDTNSRIDMFRKKAEDPTELAKKIAEVKQELDRIERKLGKGVNEVVLRFRGEEGIIRKKAEAGVADFLKEVKKIDAKAEDAFANLEKASIETVDKYTKAVDEINNMVLKEFDEKLIKVNDKGTIPFESIKPSFTSKTFEEIKNSTESEAVKNVLQKDCLVFKKMVPTYMQNIHFERVKNDIIGRLDIIKNDLIECLEDNVDAIRSRYIEELSNTANVIKNELDAIQEAKMTAEQNQEIIKHFSMQVEQIINASKTVSAIEGGINKNVQ